MPIDQAIGPATQQAPVLLLKTRISPAALSRIPKPPDHQTSDAGRKAATVVVSAWTWVDTPEITRDSPTVPISTPPTPQCAAMRQDVKCRSGGVARDGALMRGV